MKKSTIFKFGSVVAISAAQLAFSSSSFALSNVPHWSVSSMVGLQSKKCVGVKKNSKSDGASLELQKCSSKNKFQSWRFEQFSSGYFRIRNMGSSRCLDVPKGTSKKGTSLKLYKCNNNTQQQWYFDEEGLDRYGIVSKKTGQALDVSGGKTSSGAKIIQWTWKKSSNQKWVFPGVSGKPVGFARGTTGGKGGKTITVTKPDELKKALKSKDKLIIRVKGMIDFRKTEGSKEVKACVYSHKSCNVNGKAEKILDVQNRCKGKKVFKVKSDKAGYEALLVASNKTIIGVGRKSGIKGKGLEVAHASNIIIRNLNITDINDGLIFAGDAIKIRDANKIWIDHNYFARIGRQFIAAGSATVQNVTISNNFLDGRTQYSHYCDGRHYWNMLLLGLDQTITIANNHFYMTTGRAPKVSKFGNKKSTGMIHFVNNYFDKSAKNGLEFSKGKGGVVLMEGNYYRKGSNFSAIAGGSTSEPLFAPLTSSIKDANASCKKTIGRSCQANRDDGNSNTSNFVYNSSAMSNLGKNKTWLKGVKSIKPDAYYMITKSTGFGPQ